MWIENVFEFQCAVGHDYQAPLSQHVSQTDGAKGFGGKFGVQEDRKDKSAAGWDHHEKIDKHESQTGITISLTVICSLLLLRVASLHAVTLLLF